MKPRGAKLAFFQQKQSRITCLFIRICRARYIVKSASKRHPNKKVIVVVVWVSVLVIFLCLISEIRNVIEVIKECFSDANFNRGIPFWIHDIFKSATKR